MKNENESKRRKIKRKTDELKQEYDFEANVHQYLGCCMYCYIYVLSIAMIWIKLIFLY